ncbi:hypothetical protein A2943_02190 [Candidatus Adlerbacteria bacterium RIFCSPLOWO2_01_FULL_51_16]|uniref:Type 4 fimbrial biogenesis protein PilX N-terminal domain-containing protein n=1 Tax=Candidatus Adlerbacteria bacterium RIFCSPLOWO2_01_FULL_51_16 TaxID=1797243 RepID=A0A1F4XFN7_9BACT|nr:MAG: hypothetical protein A2943_02190 [Candidatus Adlerbacteria bacterium RIFCSPLOWO2_01_FULL_51_16]
MIPQPKGFIALISVIIISFVLLITVLSFAQFGIVSRFLLLDLERKEASENLAAACVQVAIIAVYNDSLYEVTDRSVPVGSEECVLTIEASTPFLGRSQIQTTASSTGATTNLEVVIDSASGVIQTWEELASF